MWAVIFRGTSLILFAKCYDRRQRVFAPELKSSFQLERRKTLIKSFSLPRDCRTNGKILTFILFFYIQFASNIISILLQPRTRDRSLLLWHKNGPIIYHRGENQEKIISFRSKGKLPIKETFFLPATSLSLCHFEV